MSISIDKSLSDTDDKDKNINVIKDNDSKDGISNIISTKLIIKDFFFGKIIHVILINLYIYFYIV